MSPTDSHVWASTAKTTVGAVVAMLVEEGKVDPEQDITYYIPELKGVIGKKSLSIKCSTCRLR